MEIKHYHRPESLNEAYDLVVKQGGQPLGGGAWSATTSAKMTSAVDLSALGLEYIRAEGDSVVLGAMATARALETSKLLADRYGSLFSNALAHIAGVQIRNVVSVGGSVAGRYGFSELLVVLLALDARVVCYKEPACSLEDFLRSPRSSAVLIEKIVLPPVEAAAYQSLRIAYNDFPVLSVCVSRGVAGWRVAVGARPQAARLALKAAEILGGRPKPDKDAIVQAGALAAQELTFGDDIRASSTYRRSICPVLVKRALEEALP
jgi:CO/xanthine dehydrogenase FAD-binding subunit